VRATHHGRKATHGHTSPALAIGPNGHVKGVPIPEVFCRRRFHVRTAATSAACLVAVLLANGAGAALSSSARARPARSHVLAGGSAHRSAATLDVVSGTTSVEVTAGTRSGLLYRVRTPAGSGVRPLATLDDGTLRVGQAADGTHAGVPVIDIQLARGVRWTINLGPLDYQP
jgi:hypothetical protein